MTKTFVSRLLRRLSFFVGAGLVGMLAFSLFGRPPALSSSAQAAARSVAASDYDLSSMEVLKRVVVYVKDNYVDPKRIDAKEMFVAALEAIEKNTAEVMVEGAAKDGRVRVTAGGQARDFEFGDVDGVWRIPQRLRPVFEFIQANVSANENRHDIEYAAINGMLSTLDPHSWLLKPDAYREMKLQTRGEFGGLGFVIALEEERLTVKKVLKNTPAARGGLKRGDHIAQIDDESTINMDLSEAVSKMRGKPGTEVRLVVRRDKDAPKTFRLTRDLISVESVTSRLLEGGVGYVRLSSFAGTTARELSQSVREMRQQSGGRLKGLVLDLRSNPGGLLDQAHQVADQFVDEGTIVTTAGMSDKLREAKEAHSDPGDKEFPLVVLVNAQSASASEIVAGALRNLDRAVIVGRQTFGKGSVQVLYDMLEPGTKEEEALKLTIAQYLTPGDRSIQETGVTPDIELLPALVSTAHVDLYAPPRVVREADLDKHFSNGFQSPEAAAKAVAAVERPSESLRYLRTDVPDKKKDAADEDDEAAEEPDDEKIATDPQVEFARELLLHAPRTERPAMLQAAKAFLAERREREDAKIQQAIEALGLDWTQSKVRPAGTPQAKVEFRVTPERPVAGQTATLEVAVTNGGGAPYERLRAFTQCGAEKTRYQGLCTVFDRQEFLFGKVAPGETRRWSTDVKVPAYLPTIHETFSLVFQDAQGLAPAPQQVDIETLEAARPTFAFTYEVQDKDGVAVPGETVDVRVDVRNAGTGPASKAWVSLRNKKNDKVFMKKGRVAIGALAPGEVKSALLTLEVRPGLDTSEGIPLSLEVGDDDVWPFTTDKIVLAAADKAPAYTDKTGAVKLRADVTVAAAPQASAPGLFEGRAGTVLAVKARSGEWLKVEAAKGRTGWVRASDTVPENKAGAAASLAPVWREPPRLSFAGLDLGRAAVVTDQDHLVLGGSADDATGVMDVRVFVDNEKVFFHTAKAAKGGREQHMAFEADLPLKPGNNQVLVVAREDGEFTSQRTIVVHRRGPAVAGRPAAPVAPTSK
jgi:carboxyl-terminal processing protease